jgi:hypothetical protein
MILIMLFDFIHVLNIKRTHYTKNYYLSNHNLFTVILFTISKKLMHNNYFEQKINMSYFL